MEIKQEPVAKPKFVPKVPVKKEKAAEGPSNQQEGGQHARSSASAVELRRLQQAPMARHAGESGRGGGRNVRSHRPMPQGRIFFQGANTQFQANNNRQVHALIATQTSSVEVSNKDAGGTDLIQAPGSNRVVGKTRSSLATTTTSLYKNEEYDSEADDELRGDHACDEDGSTVLGGGEHEIWPPAALDASAPMSLPHGPRTLGMQELLAQRPLFADSSNQQALTDEELDQVFLMQLPSSLSIQGGREQLATESAHSSSSVPSNKLSGHIGKLQVLKSGKIRLLLPSGKSYDVHSGLPTSFAQYVVAIDMDKTDSKVKSETKYSGSLDLLGGITQKIVVSDTFV